MAQFHCHSCGHQQVVADEYLHRLARCPRCQRLDGVLEDPARISRRLLPRLVRLTRFKLFRVSCVCGLLIMLAGGIVYELRSSIPWSTGPEVVASIRKYAGSFSIKAMPWMHDARSLHPIKKDSKGHDTPATPHAPGSSKSHGAPLDHRLMRPRIEFA